MPRYLVERVLGQITDDEMHRAADASTRLRLARFPGIRWEHSHVVHAEGGLTVFCVYDAPDAAMIRGYSVAVGLPLDPIHEIHADLVSQEAPEASALTP